MTIRWRLVATALASILAAVAAFAVAAVLLVRSELRGTLDSALRQRAEDVAQLAVSAPAVLSTPGALESAASGRQIVVEVLDAHARILARSLTLGSKLLPVLGTARVALSAGRPGFADVHVSGRPFRLYAAPVAQAGGPASGGVVLVASDTSDISDALGRLGFVLALAGVGAVLVAALAAALLTRRGLRPLERLAAGAAEIELTADPGRRLPVSSSAPSSDEVARLTAVLNRMLASLERSRESERRFLADASHELRTPVTSLLGNVEFAVRHGADAEVLADLSRDAERLARLVDDLLVLERERAADAVVSESMPLEQVVDDVVASMDGRDRVRVHAQDGVSVAGDRVALQRVVQNLIENALVHGPPQGSVDVVLARAGSGADAVARLSVSDSGSGPASGDRTRVFERFWRGSDASERPGSGLGLSIVAAIVARHHGSVEVDGSTFSVSLPLAASEVDREPR